MKLAAIGATALAACALGAAAPAGAIAATGDGAGLQQRLNALLDATVGPGKARVSVNVVLDRNRVRATSLRYARRATALTGQTASTRYTAAGTSYRARSGATSWARGADITATTYAPGAVRQVHVGLIVSNALPLSEAKRLKRVIATAAGVNRARGDTLALTRAAFARPAAPATRSWPVPARWMLLGLGVSVFLGTSAVALRRGS